MRKEQGTKDKNWRKHLLQCQRYKLENGKRRRSEGGRQIEAYTLVTGKIGRASCRERVFGLV